MGALKFQVSVTRRELYLLIKNDRKARILSHFIFLTPRKGKDNYKVFMEEEMTRNIDDDKNLNGCWIYKSTKELIKEVMLSVSIPTARKYIKDLVKEGYLFERNNPKQKWDRKKQYRVNMLKLISDLNKIGEELTGFEGADILLERIKNQPKTLISRNLSSFKSNLSNLKSILSNLKTISESTTKSTTKRTKKRTKFEEEEEERNFKKSYQQAENKKEPIIDKVNNKSKKKNINPIENENNNNRVNKDNSNNSSIESSVNTVPFILIKKYREIFNRKLSSEVYNKMKKLYSDDDIIYKSLLVAELNGDMPSYLIAVLRDWKKNKLVSVDEIDSYLEEKNNKLRYKSKSKAKGKSKAKNSKSGLDKVFSGLNKSNDSSIEKEYREKRNNFKKDYYR